MKKTIWERLLVCFLVLLIPISVFAGEIPASPLTEDDLSDSLIVTAYYNEHLDTVAYYPSMNEEDLVALGCAYLAPMIVFDGDKPELLLNALIALQGMQFGFQHIDFDFSEEELSWHVEVHDASGDGFLAEEVYVPVDEKMMQALMFIADHPDEDLHVSFWGQSDVPIHFSLTPNQKATIKAFLELYFGIEQMQTISI